MTTISTAGRDSTCGAQSGSTGRWLSLAASPTFALMAIIAAKDASPMAHGASASLPLDGMTAMYLLMSLFHLPPWLKRTSPGARPRS